MHPRKAEPGKGAVARVVPILAFAFLSVACGERTFPLQSAKGATSVRVNGTLEITRPADLNRLMGIVGQYDSWRIVPECRTNECSDMRVEWISDGKTQVTMSLCMGGQRARVGEPGVRSPCGRRVPERDAKELLTLLATQGRAE